LKELLSRITFRLFSEPPFRLIARYILKLTATKASTRALWEISARPHYLMGILAAAEQAQRQGVKEISVIEFGVAGGNGLVVMQEEAEAVELETGIRIKVFGFDMGAAGLPEFIGDYRDHPDIWQPGDYPMDEAKLRARLSERTTLVLGNVAQTVQSFFEKNKPPPIGFISIDVDIYSSSRDALNVLLVPSASMLWHVPIYFDDIEFIFNHRFAGELLAIDEFNEISPTIKIDKWYGVGIGRPFPERYFLQKMYVAHDLTAGPTKGQRRSTGYLPLKD
jgi:hypothetical protein